jgi:hypothetical protein
MGQLLKDPFRIERLLDTVSHGRGAPRR